MHLPGGQTLGSDVEDEVLKRSYESAWQCRSVLVRVFKQALDRCSGKPIVWIVPRCRGRNRLVMDKRELFDLVPRFESPGGRAGCAQVTDRAPRAFSISTKIAILFVVLFF